MPKITIREVDLTSPGQLNSATNTVYVPGFASHLPVDFDGNPRYYDDLSTFIEEIGEKVYIADNTYAEGYKPCTGHLYALELLRLGIPVIYDCIHYEYPRVYNDTVNNVETEKTRTRKDILDNIIIATVNGNTTSRATTYEKDIINGDELIASIAVYNEKTDIIYSVVEPKNTNTNIGYYIEDKNIMYIDYATTNATSGNNTYQGAFNKFMTTRCGSGILEDKSNYNIKFLTTGGYIDKSISDSLATIASSRGDCTALIDHGRTTKHFELSDTEISGYIPTGESAKYAAMFTPWAVYAVPSYGSVELPASFGYLAALASATRTAPNWYAMAGAQRGGIPYIKETLYNMTEAQANNYQKRDNVSINPILRVSPYGLIIWGNRTLFNNAAKGNLTASSFLNIRNLCSDLKKTIWTAARSVTFEPNNDLLWVNFKSLITPTLDKMVSGNGISGYELKKRVSKQKATLDAVVRIYPIEAVEDFEIEIQLADNSTADITEQQ